MCIEVKNIITGRCGFKKESQKKEDEVVVGERPIRERRECVLIKVLWIQ